MSDAISTDRRIVTKAKGYNPSVARGVSSRRPNSQYPLTSTIAFDRETFEQIRKLAVKEGISFGAAVRLLVEWGLEA